ncbi:acetate uptake transporter [Actinacidiphila acidipaludis]|uniref:Acetate uptake transporter n=1 Tax=Actinacidiphila acidipaludis TaxID=2873382 RepID=A0ABS7Q816_9ACTN|nr:acetate uptake transporter [Streptomyces acidipaludis]MBY8879093.1 acetate uptake transporter [Streptomyces acidipaludis]
MPEPPARIVADPAPLGLAAFGATTFMLSLFNAGVRPSLVAAVFPTAFLFGGVVQLVAGIFELRQGGTFGGTAFSAFGAFWMSYAAFGHFIVPTLPPGQAPFATGMFALPWAILAFYLTVATLRTNCVLLALFTGATTTLTLLSIAEFLDSDPWRRAGGATGLITAGLALYGSFAGVINTTWGRPLIPTFPDPGKRLAHLGHRMNRPLSLTSSAGEREVSENR